MTVKVLK